MRLTANARKRANYKKSEDLASIIGCSFALIVLLVVLAFIVFGRLFAPATPSVELVAAIKPPVETETPDWMNPGASAEKTKTAEVDDGSPIEEKVEKPVAKNAAIDLQVGGNGPIHFHQAAAELSEESKATVEVELTAERVFAEQEPEAKAEPKSAAYADLVDIEVWGKDAENMARTLYGEAPHCSKVEQAAVYWCILNRVDNPRFCGQNTPSDVCMAENQFHGFSTNNPVDPGMYNLALDVIGRWLAEKAGDADVGRVLPYEYQYFYGDNLHNHFCTGDMGSGCEWDWSLPNPYEEVDV